MKRIIYTFVLFLTSTGLFAQQQLPNVGFENWSSEFLFEGLADWNCFNASSVANNPGLTKSEDAYSGNYSVKMQTLLVGEDTAFTFIYHGYVTDDGPGGGIPYSETFDRVSGYYKADLVAEDSAVMILIKYLNMVPAMSFAKIGTDAAEWTQFSFDVPAAACDSVFIGFISSDVIMETNAEPGSWIMLDSITFGYSGGEDPDPTLLPNYDMEIWVDNSIENPDSWYTLNDFLYGVGTTGVTKTEDSNSGTYAAEIVTNFVNGSYTIAGYLSLGEIDMNGTEPISSVPYTDQPEALRGAYKYLPQGDDVSFVQILFENETETVAGGYQVLLPATEYTEFILNLNYTGENTKLKLIFYSGENENSALFLDDVLFDFGTKAKENFVNSGFAIYPNPATDFVYINFASEENSASVINVIDLQGRVVKTIDMAGLNNNRIDISELSKGIYLLKADNSKGGVQKLIVK